MVDLDHRITTALRTAADATDVADDALDTILSRAANHRPARRRRRVAAGLAAAAALSGAGAAWAIITDRPDERTAAFIEATPCGLNADDAQLVASSTDDSGTVQFWWIHSPGGTGAYVVDTDGSGGGGCGLAKTGYDPTPPWGALQMTVDESGDGRYLLYGQVPPHATGVSIVTTVGSFEATLGVGGHFITAVEGPWGQLELTRIDALDSDGNVVAFGRDGD